VVAGVSADEIKTIELKAFRRVGHGGSDDIAENVGFAAAGRHTGRRDEGLPDSDTISALSFPLNSQFVPDF
jgi:hypothetical protein